MFLNFMGSPRFSWKFIGKLKIFPSWKIPLTEVSNCQIHHVINSLLHRTDGNGASDDQLNHMKNNAQTCL